jgi:energy-coupling factor transporter ATP-binding protein EcfA2
MSTTVITAENLSKRYQRGMAGTSGLLRDTLALGMRAPHKLFRRDRKESFWALKDVSLDVPQGEVLGLIGRNGSGKTTLLKILSRITRPTAGWAEIRGRVGSLFEVGTGFHPELTGRENAYLSGAILGMGKQPLSFDSPQWQNDARALALRTNHQRPHNWIDFFAFRKGLFRGQIPEFVVGRPGWDNWLLWFARSSGALVVDVSSVVCAIHQNHDYGYHPQGEKGVWEGEEAQQNYKLLDGHRKFRTLKNATHLLRADGLHRNYRHWLVQTKRSSYDLFSPAWFRVLDLTRPLRHRMGLRQKGGTSV